MLFGFVFDLKKDSLVCGNSKKMVAVWFDSVPFCQPKRNLAIYVFSVLDFIYNLTKEVMCKRKSNLYFVHRRQYPHLFMNRNDEQEIL